MPGTGIDMGMGSIGNPGIIFKRKYRWTFSLETCKGTIPEWQVKLAARPNISIEETEINFLHGKMYIPGKATWETITVTYYDLANINGGEGSSLTSSGNPSLIYDWLATVYNFADPVGLHQASSPGNGTSGGGRGYSGTGSLYLYDGCGKGLEWWQLQQVWPQAINFGELDYSSSEEVTIELTLRYRNAKYKRLCPDGVVKPCECAGC
jgi:hypothetical protein